MPAVQQISANTGATTRFQVNRQLDQAEHLVIGNIGQPQQGPTI
jgi:hypothetical protein